MRTPGVNTEAMTARRPLSRWTRAGALLAGAVFLFAACAENAPQDTLDPQGPIARRLDNLFEPVFWIAVGVFVLVEGLVLFISIRFRQRKGDERIPTQVHGNKRLELAWTILPTVILAAIAVPTIGTIFALAKEPPDDRRVDITIVAHQWWWEVRYTDTDPEIVTANEIHIPTGKPVYFRLESRNQNPKEIPVIHSFWIPPLGGKQDVIPGRVNTLTVEAERPGTYLGQCVEYCGISHAYMRLRAIAHTPEDFEAWLDDQAEPAAEPDDPLAAEGMALFRGFETSLGRRSCIECHAVNGLEGAVAAVGPDLTHLFSRETFAGAILPLTEERLRAWLDDPGALKPGAKMPDYDLSPEQIDALVAYLLTLE